MVEAGNSWAASAIDHSDKVNFHNIFCRDLAKYHWANLMELVLSPLNLKKIKASVGGYDHS